MGQSAYGKRARPAAMLLAVALACLHASDCDTQVLDIAQTPLASASNLAVLPNLLFILDDSGSMMFDSLPDRTERVQGGAERRYWHENFNCKPKGGIQTQSSSPALNVLTPNHCARTDPLFGAVEYNGMYYNPQFTYRPPLNSDGTSYPAQTSWSAVTCDPFTSNWKCKDWYGVSQGHYDSATTTAQVDSRGWQRYTNRYTKQWYGSGPSFNVQGEWPEIVYCLSETGDVNKSAECRRNGVDTANPFRYTTARWGAGYPDASAVHEFSRPSSASVVSVRMAYPHGQTSGTLKIIPCTGTGTSGSGFDVASGSVSATPSSTDPYVFTYNLSGRTGQLVAEGSFDFVVALKGTGSTVEVTNAWNHGLSVGDQLSISQTTCLSGSCGFSTATVTVTAVGPGPNTFQYQPGKPTTTSAEGYYRKVNLYNYPKLRRGNPHYYTIEAVDYCRDSALTQCKDKVDGAYTIPAPVRYCTSQFDAYRLDTPTGNETNGSRPRCRKKYEEATGYVYLRYGQFRRVDITAQGVFGQRPLRTDRPNRPVCSYAEEMTNFANWFAYYRTRMLMMKTATGVAFSPIDARYRVGFVTINPDTPVRADRYLKIDLFTPTQKRAWYETLYDQEPRGGTPMPQALSRAGRYFAGVREGINRGMDDDPVQFSCQQNFALLTTDGYWSGRGGIDLDGAAIGNLDNDAAKTPRPVYDGGKPFNPDPSDFDFSSSGTLADVAPYYYETDLRNSAKVGASGEDVSQNNVPTGTKDTANWQHMVTFGLGMAEGLMDWRPDYESPDAKGDFDNVRRGALNACTWELAGGACNWPMPGSRSPSNLDDLWRAAVNGHGRSFYARDRQSVQDSMNTALTNLNERNASGASAATSTPNITPTDRAIFLTSYTTVQWYGDVQSRLIDPNTGDVLPTVAWSARDRLQGVVGETTDKRNIYLADYAAPEGLKPFRFDSLTKEEQTWFSNKCVPVSNLTQCALLDPATDRVTANSGENLVNFLRGQSQYEARVYRDRDFVLGDTVNSVPLYVARPRYAFGDRVSLPYLTWRDRPEIRDRTPTLYIGANDGQLHAINVVTGDELWALIPRQLAPDLWRLAEDRYATNHRYYVDGSPVAMDVWDGGTWRTIVVTGLNGGGRGYFALDVTNPNAPRALWEFCSDPKLCPIADPDMGYSFGNPVITKRASDGRWVVLVTSGYNNVGPGDGRGYLFVLDALSGNVLDKIATGAGGELEPIGLGRIAAWADNFTIDNTAKWVYGGDQQGNIWRFDLTGNAGKVIKLAQALDDNGVGQPITTKPELGLIDGTYRVVFVGTGRYFAVSDLTDPATQQPQGTWAWQQSVYAFKDRAAPMGSLRAAVNKLVAQTVTELSGGAQRTASSTRVDWATQGGWYVDLNPNGASPGERVSVDPQLALGTLLVTTNVPGATARAIGGDSWVYQFDYRAGTYVPGAYNSVVARKQTGALTAGLVVYQLQKGSLIGQIQRTETKLKQEDIVIAPAPMKSRRTSWREITPDYMR